MTSSAEERLSQLEAKLLNVTQELHDVTQRLENMENRQKSKHVFTMKTINDQLLQKGSIVGRYLTRTTITVIFARQIIWECVYQNKYE